MARARGAAKTASAGTAASMTFKCPECGRTFTRAAALGTRRRQADGVAGASAPSAAARKRRSAPNSLERRSVSRAVDYSASCRSRAHCSERRRRPRWLIPAIFPQGVRLRRT